MRVDLWLFQSRLFKSRTQATNACKEGRILRKDKKLDAADGVAPNDLIEVRERGMYRKYRILVMPGKNVSKEIAKTTYEEETAVEVIEKFKAMLEARRTGFDDNKTKPSKKDRRDLRKVRGW